MEDVAEWYLGELIDRCMVQVKKMGSNGRPETCHLHDVMRYFCLSKANEEKFLQIVPAQNVVINETPISDRAHRFSVYGADCKALDLGYYARTPHLRSLLFFGTYAYDSRIISSTFANFKVLKTLRLEYCEITKETAKEIGGLIHLRYLAFESCVIDCDLPPSIFNLRYLHTFILDCVPTSKIPNVLWKVEQLRHLEIKSYQVSWKKLLKLGNMRNLRTLRGVRTRSFDVAELVKFSNLKDLKIEFYLRPEEGSELIPSVCLNLLTSLFISFSLQSNYMYLGVDMKGVFSCCHQLQTLHVAGKIQKLPEYQMHFFPNLTELTLRGCELKEDPMSTLEKLPNLVFLFLGYYSFRGTLLVCSSKGFPRLKTLVLEKLWQLEEWRVDEEAMPCLSQLRIEACRSLKMVPDGIKFITTLRQLEISYMTKKFEERVRVVDGREGEDLHKIQHVTSIVLYNNILLN